MKHGQFDQDEPEHAPEVRQIAGLVFQMFEGSAFRTTFCQLVKGEAKLK